jgi:hypothetical protein
MIETSPRHVRFVAGALSALALTSLLSACGQEPGEVPAEDGAPAVPYEEHMANVQAFVAEAQSGTVSGQWTNYPPSSSFCYSGQCRNIHWIGGTINEDANYYSYNLPYSFVVFRQRTYSQSQDPYNYAYVTAAFAAVGNPNCDGDDIILSFYSTTVANSSPGELHIKRDNFLQTGGLSYIVWRDGWIDMCKGTTYPNATEFKK